ncbi:MAG TPA: hypothetical protein DIT01_11260, partial [Lentisphaeria bacterium]|nr:hypothetical protein [Lentisphaeria bacterium]
TEFAAQAIENQKLRDKNAGLNRMIEKLSDQLNRLKENSGIDDALVRLQQQTKLSKLKLKELETQRHGFNTRVAELEDRMRKLSLERETAQQTLAAERRTHEARQSHLTEIGAQLQKMSSSNLSLTTQLQARDKKIGELQANVEDLNRLLDDAHEQSGARLAAERVAQGNLNRLKTQADELLQAKEKLQEQLSSSDQKHVDAERTIGNLENRLAEAQQQLQDNATAAAGAAAVAEPQAEALDDLRHELQNRELRLEALQRQVAEGQKQLRAAVGARTKAETGAHQQSKRNTELQALLTDQIDATRKYAQQIRAQKKEITEVSDLVRELEIEHDEQRRALDTQHGELEVLMARNHQLTEGMKQNNEQYATRMTELGKLRVQLMDITGKFKTAHVEAESNREKYQAQRDLNRVLEQDVHDLNRKIEQTEERLSAAESKQPDDAADYRQYIKSLQAAAAADGEKNDKLEVENINKDAEITRTRKLITELRGDLTTVKSRQNVGEAMYKKQIHELLQQNELLEQ